MSSCRYLSSDHLVSRPRSNTLANLVRYLCNAQTGSLDDELAITRMWISVALMVSGCSASHDVSAVTVTLQCPEAGSRCLEAGS
jgi:hypothetical protein